jgi:hypothetical protein
MSGFRDVSSVCAEIQRHLRAQAPHSVVLGPVLELAACAQPQGPSDAARLVEQLAATFSSYLNNWASLAHGRAVAAFARAIGALPPHASLAVLLKSLRQSATVDGSLALVQLISDAFTPVLLDGAFSALRAEGASACASAEDIFRLVVNVPSAAAAVLKQQTPSWLDSDVFVPAFITAALIKLAAADALLLDVVLSQSCVHGYMRPALAAIDAITEEGSDIAQSMQGAVAAMKLPVLLRVIDHTVQCCRYRRAHRAVLGAVLRLPASHAAVGYVSTDVWRQRSLTHNAACALVDLLLSVCIDFGQQPLQTALHCLSDMFSRDAFANSGHECHHFAVCAALRRMLMVPNPKMLASGIMPLLFNGISGHLKCLVDGTRRRGMWVAEAIAPLLSAQGSEQLQLLSAEERAQLQKQLETEEDHPDVPVLFHMARDVEVAPRAPQSRSVKSLAGAADCAASTPDAASSGMIGISISDDGWGSDSDDGRSSALGAGDSDEDEVARYDLPTEAQDKTWRSLEEGVQLLLHEDASKVEQALRAAARSIRCSRQMVPEFSDRLWKALQHARAKFDEDALSVCALSAMSQVCCAQRASAPPSLGLKPTFVTRPSLSYFRLLSEILWAAVRWSLKISGAANAASGARSSCTVPFHCIPSHAARSQRLCALDVLVAACEAIRGSPSPAPAAEPLLPDARAAAAGVTKWRSKKLNVVNSAPKSNRFGVIGANRC